MILTISHENQYVHNVKVHILQMEVSNHHNWITIKLNILNNAVHVKSKKPHCFLQLNYQLSKCTHPEKRR